MLRLISKTEEQTMEGYHASNNALRMNRSQKKGANKGNGAQYDAPYMYTAKG